jgi:hypothetical protein
VEVPAVAHAYRPKEDLTTEEAGDLLQGLHNVPCYEWRHLSRRFVDNLRDDQVRRSK